MDLIVDGESEKNEKFEVKARVLSVSGHGGMMVLDVPLDPKQPLTLYNLNTVQKSACRVVSARTGRDGKHIVSFEFDTPEVNFWKMAFPAPGAKPVRRYGPHVGGPLPS